MVNFCAVYGCHNQAGRDSVSYFRFPAINLRFNPDIKKLQTKRRRAWINAIKRADLSNKKCHNYRVCSLHFITGKPAQLLDENNPDWIPCQHLGHGKNAKVLDLNRHERVLRRRQQKQESTADSDHECNELSDLNESFNDTENESFNDTNIHTQTDMTCNDIQCLEMELQKLNLECYQLKESLSLSLFTEEGFLNQPEKMLFYTGLPSLPVFNFLLETVSPFIITTSSSTLTKFQQLFLTMMKLRLNRPFTDLGYRFGISNRTASRIFYSVIHVMCVWLQMFVLWPGRDQLQKTMPLSFQHTFGKTVAIIIDCFEIFIERPSNLLARCQTWSQYKHHHTLKYLIGITPQGVISFVSEGWGGRASDKHITIESGLLKKIIPGDVLLADRGFNITDEVGFYCATINIPAFTKGKLQLEPKDVEKTRKIASVRIHVERVIGNIKKKYKILN